MRLMLKLHLCLIVFAMFDLDHCFPTTFLVLNLVSLANNKMLLKSPKVSHANTTK